MSGSSHALEAGCLRFVKGPAPLGRGIHQEPDGSRVALGSDAASRATETSPGPDTNGLWDWPTGCVQERDCKTATAKSGRPTATTAAAFAGPGPKASGIWRTASERWIGATEPVSLAEPLSAEKQMTVLSLARPCFAYPGARHRRANQAANKTGLYENTCWNRDTY
ncbi:hypothetical protein IscW_ISCW022239 [Ixodes scapularis]|uniref:Uncharacterized protein n=1 Tax=Ixodes scapularis TaxID=6945 RepID=B7QEP4_IXOSC|nr:hypothetical protein IscW_ISCW022239 [Ixodes scapularis]|eukprot:XP_002414008.1 hypothetical protein IscW_ISCW022239 [Ixodes scapularis]